MADERQGILYLGVKDLKRCIEYDPEFIHNEIETRFFSVKTESIHRAKKVIYVSPKGVSHLLKEREL